MTRRILAALFLASLMFGVSPGWESQATGAGFAFDANFIVQTPEQKLADEILANANTYRRELAARWLAQPLAAGEGKTLIHVDIVADEFRGRFQARHAVDDKMHTLWLSCSAAAARGEWLKRYVAQIVVHTETPAALPTWAMEGIAGQHDAVALKQQRAQMLKWFEGTGRWPEMQSLLDEDYLNTADRAALTAAPSLIEYLITRGDEPTVIAFVLDGASSGWDAALSKHYQIQDVAQLQTQWQTWVTASLRDVEHLPENYAPPRYVESQHRAASARSENFTVYAHDRQMAVDVLKEVEQLREEIAIEWLGEPLPPGIGRTIVSVRITADKDRANSLIDDPAQRTAQIVWIRTPPDRVHSALGHEIAHTVLATRFAFELPVWAHEGIASQRDDPTRRAYVKNVLAEISRTGGWPRLEGLLASDSISHGDVQGYAVAVSLTEFLTAHGDNATFVKFAVAGKKKGWDAALREHYGIANVRELQTAWQSWAN